ncbi:hypothetical protein D7V97_03130 [Corallococcus sp. CA053C]|uniref:hypothetical protein n=1 Tax=Corallococcus sp. CA053C TaxID=2316732 RepID=UPI000EA16982|nr:hypothetical protein [Corallococcus sp. CA053C]RKH14426.1 hypothetical protein D7V97_03130 [Corallococcus sp. CA053C]
MAHSLLRLPRLLPLLATSLLAACGGGDGDGPGDGPGPGGACVRDISGKLGGTTSWAPGDERCVYAVTGVVEVSGALTLAPGTEVRFGPNAGLLITPTGSLNAVGTEALPITFTSTTAAPGFWKGLAFKSNTPANVLEHVVISYAGNEDPFCCDFFYGAGGGVDVRAAVVVGSLQDSISQVRIAHTTVEKSGTLGLFAFNKARLPGFSQNIFRGNLGAPVTVSMSIVGALDATTVYSGNSATNPAANGDNVVHVVGAPVADSGATQTMHKLDVPYGISTGLPNTTVSYTGALTIEPGTRLQFEAQSGLRIEGDGSLVARGTAAERIVFTGRTATPGFWKGISIRSAGGNSVIAFAEVSNGGSDAFCCDYFTNDGDIVANISVGGAVGSSGLGRLQLTDTVISQSPAYGVYVFKTATFSESGNTYSNNAQNLGRQN